MTDLTDRMRTCAAHILATIPDEISVNVRVTRHAADLLIEASNALESYQPNTPMEIMPPLVAQQAAASPTQDALWIAPGGPLPGLKHSSRLVSRPCPRCDNHAAKRVRRVDNALMLTCTVCGHQWTWRGET